ncbi:hypothetical protein RTBOTA2_003982 [Rhodotorula toruloides]|nr:hypothetical protein RTBOTA2_003982 [Rhodotorula toruloides]
MSLSSPSAHPIRDLVRTELQDGWHRFDRMMEDSELLGSGPNGSAMEFTQWDGMKRAASDAAKEGRKDVQVLRSRAAQASQVALPPFFTLPAYRRPDTLLASQALTNPYPSLSTPSLSHDATLHSRFAEQYLTYAGRDAKEAARQAGMAGREVFEVGRRKVIGTDGDADPTHAKPTLFKSLESHLMRPNGYPTNAAIAAADAALLGIGIDLGVGMGIGG